MVRTLNAGYADAAPDGGLDASERDVLFDVLGLHFTDASGLAPGGTKPPVGSWPTFSVE